MYINEFKEYNILTDGKSEFKTDTIVKNATGHGSDCCNAAS